MIFLGRIPPHTVQFQMSSRIGTVVAFKKTETLVQRNVAKSGSKDLPRGSSRSQSHRTGRPHNRLKYHQTQVFRKFQPHRNPSRRNHTRNIALGRMFAAFHGFAHALSQRSIGNINLFDCQNKRRVCQSLILIGPIYC